MSDSTVPTLGYLIQELEGCEQQYQRAERMRPPNRATMKSEELHGHIQQQLNAGFVKQQARERQERLVELPGFDRLQVYCEAKWGEGVTLQNATRIRGTICQSGVKLDDATGMTFEQAADALENLLPDLTPSEQRLWQADFQERYSRLCVSVAPDEAKRRAEQYAWSKFGFKPREVRDDTSTTARQVTAESTPSSTETVETPPPAVEAAYQSFFHAQGQSSEPLTDQQAYGWFKENAPDEYNMPVFETWRRYVRAGRKHYGTQKNSPRSGRTGRSVVKPGEL
jgi:hypothetical protein